MTTKRMPDLDITAFERVPPHNLEAEQSVLGSMLLSADAIAVVLEIIKPDDFYREVHKLIYDAICKMYLEAEPIDTITVSETLKKMSNLEKCGGKPYIYNLANLVPTAANAKYYAEIVARNSVLRGLITAATGIAAIGYDAPDDLARAVDEADKLLFNVTQKRVSENFIHIKPLLTESFEQISRLAELKRSVTGISTGFTELDRMTSGLHDSDLIIVAARPEIGRAHV